ncbi:MAG: hypothetical protein ACD_75C01202G0002 [uncultured bacterium]|nr:MAG: hypothetical protein ACD_75C01202G0002 [uncultured bacterium]
MAIPIHNSGLRHHALSSCDCTISIGTCTSGKVSFSSRIQRGATRELRQIIMV